MSKAISTKTAGQRKLETLEKEINTEAFEAFYHIGQKLQAIKRERLYEHEGFVRWEHYTKSGRLVDFTSRSQADRYIQASELRPKVAHIVRDIECNSRMMLELCKCETDKDAQRVAKKSIALAKKLKQRVTAKLIAQVRDSVDETDATNKKRDASLQAASLETHLGKLADTLVDWRTSLEAIGLEQWDSVPSEVLTRVKNEADALLKFLRS